MKNYRVVVGLALFAISAGSVAGPIYRWVELWTPKHGESKYEIGFNSFERMDNILNSKTISAIVRVTTVKHKVFFEKEAILESDCLQGHGTLITDYMDGSPQDTVPFVIGGGNGNSIIAETICSLAESSP